GTGEIVTSPASLIPRLGPLGGGQHSDGVRYPERVTFGGTGGGAAEHVSVSEYSFGSEAANCIATPTFRRKSATAVEVSCTFLDLKTGAPPQAVRSNTKLLGFGGNAPRYPACDAPVVLTLRCPGGP